VGLASRGEAAICSGSSTVAPVAWRWSCMQDLGCRQARALRRHPGMHEMLWQAIPFLEEGSGGLTTAQGKPSCRLLTCTEIQSLSW